MNMRVVNVDVHAQVRIGSTEFEYKMGKSYEASG